MRIGQFIGMLALGVIIQPAQKQKTIGEPQNQQQEVKKEIPSPVTASPAGAAPHSGETSRCHQCQPENKATGWYDAIAPPTWSNWALVIVGLGAVGAALRTLGAVQRQATIMERQTRAIRRQALSMRRQTTIFRKSVEVAEKNVAAARLGAEAAKEGAEATKRSVEMLVSKERARLRIDMKPLNLATKLFSVYTVDFTVNIYGATAAYIVETGCVTYALPLDAIDCEEPGSAVIFPLHSFPSVIAPNSPPLEQFAFLFLDNETLLLPEIENAPGLVETEEE